MWTFNGKNQSIINEFRIFELMVSFIVSQQSFSLGSPSVTYDGYQSISSRLTSWSFSQELINRYSDQCMGGDTLDTKHEHLSQNHIFIMTNSRSSQWLKANCIHSWGLIQCQNFIFKESLSVPFLRNRISTTKTLIFLPYIWLAI